MDFPATILTWLRVRDSLLQKNLETYGGFADKSGVVRTTRTRIIRLRNDHKASMLKCEEGLHAFHALLRDAGPETMAKFQPEATASRPGRPSGSEISQVPFAKVSTVVPESPADEAGLKIGDRIRSFGDLNWRNHEKLSKIAELVRKSEGVIITHFPPQKRIPLAKIWDYSKALPWMCYENNPEIHSQRSFSFN